MSSLNHLLNDRDRKVTCSEFSKSIDNDPCGTAIYTSRIILIDIPLPWPNRIKDHPIFLNNKTIFDDPYIVDSRILFRVPQNFVETKISIFEKSNPGNEISINFKSDAEIYKSLSDLCRGSIPKNMLIKENTPPKILVCCHGTRDTCCGSQGTKLANNLIKETNFDIQKVSHLGGHRFAPTILTLPNGRMWANLSTQDVINIVNKDIQINHIVSKYRGWWGAMPYEEQVSEKELFKHFGWDLDDNLPTIIKNQKINQDKAIYTMQSGNKKVEIEITRDDAIPIIQCKEISGGSIKYQPTFESKIISIEDI